ncbi:MAG: serine/threonine protein kinase [Anaerolineaceae bacterium]|nr:serine/threonine protein kinase [Anaerolineaceae bacterium]
MANRGPLLNTEFGPYRCMRVLGDGLNHTLYHALHRENGELVALRTIPLDEEHVELRREATDLLKSLKSILSAYTVPVIDFGFEGETLYIASRVMKGGSLETRIQRHKASLEHDSKRLDQNNRLGWPTPASCLRVIYRIAQALDDIHMAGFVHGLVDPINIMFDEHGDAYLGEMGVSQLTKILFNLGNTNSFYVSRYAAPELWLGGRPQPATDQYALGCLAYELLTGEPPYSGLSIYTLMKQHTEDALMPVNYVNPSLPDMVSLPLWRAMAKPMHERYPTVGEFVEDLLLSMPDVDIFERDDSVVSFFAHWHAS